MTNCRRSDTALFELSKKVDTINTNLYKQTDKKKIIYNNLCFTNNKRKLINDILMKEFIKTKNVNDVVYHLQKDGEQSQNVSICRGMPVISRYNNKKYDIVSNETFIIHKIIKGIVSLKSDDLFVEIQLNEFQKLFCVAFCITVDKSQGSTYDIPYVIHEWAKMNKNRRYTAVTRSTKLENLFFA